MLFDSNHYWLRNAHVLPSLIVGDIKRSDKNSNDLFAVDLEIVDGVITTIVASGTNNADSDPAIDLKGGMVWPCFVDMHTHLDKGHIWNRAPNPDGTFNSALTAVKTDAAKHWSETDVHRRMEFGLKCSYAHGTKAIRTHIDSFGEQGEIGFRVFKELRDRWAD
ncbi:MAG: amidohydrolase family protein, partial [Phormidesmis sp. CAN_BIN36]|nr:amidohydrolase family protein [Phormidesmis sp. CAN_BIN36]